VEKNWKLRIKNTPGDPYSGRTTGVLKIGIFYLVAGRKFSIIQNSLSPTSLLPPFQPAKTNLFPYQATSPPIVHFPEYQ
jgi:hypothetical protein